MLQKRIKVSPNFFLDEFLSPKIYEKLFLGKEDYWQNLVNKNDDSFYKLFFNGFKLKKLIGIAQFVRTKFNKRVTINNWGSGGDRVNSGVRDENSSVGAPKSAHKQWEAIDMLVEGMSEKKVYEAVLSAQNDFMKVGVTEIENGTWNEATGEGWTHLSTRQTGLSYIKIIPYWSKK